MSIFGGLSQQNLADSVTDPKRLFRALSKPAGSRFQFPYDIQTEVWDKWYARRDEADLIVKMNTGSGKTVIGLVILKSSLNEGKGPAVYLVPDRQLKAQVEATATELGIAWVDDPADATFRRGQSVLIATAQKMYNGLSRFGVRGTTRRPIPVGTIVVDDAHACIPIIEHEFALTIARESPMFDPLFALFTDSLKAQSLVGQSAIVAGEGTQAVPVPYWEWQHHVEAAFGIINSSASEDAVKFVWPLIRDQLALCDVAFSPRGIEIRLPYPDLSVISSFVGASRRIYMTATLADDSVLTTKMDVAPDCVTGPIVPASASDLGDRLILTPMETSASITHDDVRACAASWARSQNVVVIVPSKYRAETWRDVTTEIHDKDSVEDVVARLKAGLVGLVVLIARYDGVDLPDDACRVLILDGLPERYSPQELVEATAIGGTDAMEVRQVQRIEQGMGRGVRSTDDYCAVVLLDARLVERLYTAASQQQLSPATRAQYDLSTRFSSAGRSQSMDFFDQAITAFLSRDPQWVQASKQELEGVTYEQMEAVPSTAVAEREAFNLALVGRATDAKSRFDAVYGDVPDYRVRGWLKQRAAAYLNAVDPVGARELQRSARLDNSYILKIPNETASRRINGLGVQSVASSEYLSRTYATSRSLEVGVEAVLRDLAPSTESGSHKRFEDALEKVGFLLGFDSSRPDKESGIGPDNLWAVGADRYWVIEAKSEAIAAEISRENLAQLSQSVDWFEGEYAEPRYTALPLLIHPSNTPMWNANARQTARVMTFAKLAEFRQALRGFATAIAIGDRYRNPDDVAANMATFGLNAGQMSQRWTEEFASAALRQ